MGDPGQSGHLSRRGVRMIDRGHMIVAVAALALLSGPGLPSAWSAAGPAAPPAGSSEPKFTEIEAEESPAMRAQIDKAKAYLAAGRSTEDLLNDPPFVPTHEYPRLP